MDKEDKEKIKKWIRDAYYYSFGKHFAELFGLINPKPIGEEESPKDFDDNGEITVMDGLIDVE